MKNPSSPKEKAFALIYKGIQKCSLDEAFKFTEKYYQDYLNFFSRSRNYIPEKIETNPKYIYKELQFQGFVPEEDFKKKKNRLYIITNKTIMGKVLIYPVHCWHNIDYKEYGEPWVYDLVNQVGLASHTRVNLKYKV